MNSNLLKSLCSNPDILLFIEVRPLATLFLRTGLTGEAAQVDHMNQTLLEGVFGLAPSVRQLKCIGLVDHRGSPRAITSISMPGTWRDTGHKALCPVSPSAPRQIMYMYSRIERFS